MPTYLLPLSYARWHYTGGVRDVLLISRDFLIFSYRLFSVPLLIRTLFSPWHRLGESYKKGFAPESWTETLILNTIMRVVGVLIRLSGVVAGLLFLVFVFCASVVAMALWLVLPGLVVTLFIIGVSLVV